MGAEIERRSRSSKDKTGQEEPEWARRRRLAGGSGRAILSMRLRIDRMHLNFRFAGAGTLPAMPKPEGFQVGRKRPAQKNE
jgi:hypothetical protein